MVGADDPSGQSFAQYFGRLGGGAQGGNFVFGMNHAAILPHRTGCLPGGRKQVQCPPAIVYIFTQLFLNLYKKWCKIHHGSFVSEI
jgi:hypothetical protein